MKLKTQNLIFIIDYMNELKVNFETYSMNQLFDAFEGVDDIKYPENALTIYRLLLEKLNLNYNDVTAEVLGYKDDNSLKSWLFTLIPFVTAFEMDQDMLNNKMNEKITKLNSKLNSFDKNKNSL